MVGLHSSGASAGRAGCNARGVGGRISTASPGGRHHWGLEFRGGEDVLRPDSKRSKRFLAEHRVSRRFVDIDPDAQRLRYVEELQKSGRTITAHTNTVNGWT